jgi:hypothetical protein
MLTAIEGIYKDGKIELSETPAHVEESRVLVVFLESKTNGAPKKGQMIRHGMFAGLIETTEEDFKLAEFHGYPHDGLDWQ